MKNVVVQTPTGDMLVNQMRSGSLDAAVAYLSNAAGSADAPRRDSHSRARRARWRRSRSAVAKDSQQQATRSSGCCRRFAPTTSQERFGQEGFRWVDARGGGIMSDAPVATPPQPSTLPPDIEPVPMSPFFVAMGGLGGSYVLLIVAHARRPTWRSRRRRTSRRRLQKPEIQYAIRLTLVVVHDLGAALALGGDAARLSAVAVLSFAAAG